MWFVDFFIPNWLEQCNEMRSTGATTAEQDRGSIRKPARTAGGGSLRPPHQLRPCRRRRLLPLLLLPLLLLLLLLPLLLLRGSSPQLLVVGNCGGESRRQLLSQLLPQGAKRFHLALAAPKGRRREWRASVSKCWAPRGAGRHWVESEEAEEGGV